MNSVNTLNQTQNTNQNKWTGLILFSLNTRLHWCQYNQIKSIHW